VSVSGLLVLLAGWAGGFSAWSALAIATLVGLTLIALAGSVFFRMPDDGPLASVAVTVLAPVYVGGTLAFGVHLRGLPGVSDGSLGWDGAIVLIFPLVVTWVGDSAAYFSGRRWGRTKLLPAVSPGKTVAGAVGGLLGAVIAAAVYSTLLINPHTSMILSWASAAILGLLLGGIAQVGDLAESLLKREAGVKDSGTLLPGHGGLLDRFDSVLFTLPVTYALLLLVQ
jgi:phosphatidate cytidylyltransferase